MNGGAGSSHNAAAAAAAAGDTVQLVVPATTAVAIHFPGFVSPESPAGALATLGGEAALSAALAEQPAFLRLRLRPDDPFSHPLLGEQHQQPAGLILRIARPRQPPGHDAAAAAAASCDSEDGSSGGEHDMQQQEEEAAPRVSIVARVTAAYAFNAMADYQFLGHDPLVAARHSTAQQLQQQQQGQGARAQLSAANLPLSAEPLQRAAPFLLLPPLFSRADTPVAYGFHDSPVAPAIYGAAATSAAKAASDPRVVSFYDASTPAALPLPQPQQQQQQQGQEQQPGHHQQQQQRQRGGLTPAQQALLPQLQALLQQRPAWQAEMLLAQLPGCSEAQLKPLLAALTYQFKTGPWKGLVLACGYDPRDSPAARRYQSAAYRLPTEWGKRVRAAKQAGRPLRQPPLSALHVFAAMPTAHSTPLQLCDLQNEAIQQLVTNAPVPASASEAYGWFTYASSQQLQQALNAAFSGALQEALRQLVPQPEREQQQEQEQQQGQGMDVDQPGTSPARHQQHRQQQQQRHQQEEQEQVDAAGLLGLGGAGDELQAWLREAAATAQRQQAAAAAAAAAAGADGDGDGAASSGGLSESDWDTGGETTGGESEWGEDDDDEGAEEAAAAAAEEEEGDGFEQYNEDV